MTITIQNNSKKCVTQYLRLVDTSPASVNTAAVIQAGHSLHSPVSHLRHTPDLTSDLYILQTQATYIIHTTDISFTFPEFKMNNSVLYSIWDLVLKHQKGTWWIVLNMKSRVWMYIRVHLLCTLMTCVHVRR